jgi:hypothetical protein
MWHCSNLSIRVISHVCFDGERLMQALKSLFARRQAQTCKPAQQPAELSAEVLKQVGGGLPRVGRTEPTTTESAVVVDADKLPRVG